MSSSAAPTAQRELDEALLQRAWRMLRPPCWPPTFVETMADPLRSQMVHMFARQLLRSDAKAAAHAAWPLSTPSAPAIPFERRRSPALAAGTVDRKRAAAGDRDDD